MKRTLQITLLMILFLTTGAHAQKIGLLMDSYFIDRWYLDQKVLSDKIKELGGECITEVPNGDATEQVRLGKKLIADGVDALIIVAVDANRAVEIVEAAKEKNIPVIAYDRFVKSKGVNFYISYDNKMVGQLQAKYALEKSPSGNYLLVNGPITDNNAILVRQGQLETLKSAIDSKKITIIGDLIMNEWSEMEAMMKVDEYLSGNKTKPNVVIAGNDALATGSLQSLPQASSEKRTIIGQDADRMAIQNIIKGEQTMTVYKPIRPLASKAAEVAMQLAKKQPIKNSTKIKVDDLEVNSILLIPMVVDKNNYNETVIKDGHVTLNK